jgi:poly(3-hydroxybutyrate) depolymerase
MTDHLLYDPNPGPTQRITWVTRLIEHGLTRAYALTIEEPMSTEKSPGIAFEGIDRVLEQANALGREGILTHIQCVRWANDVVVLGDADPRYDWVLSGVESRLREELAKLNVEADTEQTQRVDLARGDRLRIGSFELHLTSGSATGPKVKCKTLKKAEEHQQVEPEVKERQECRATFLKRCLRWFRRTTPKPQENEPDEEGEDTAPAEEERSAAPQVAWSLRPPRFVQGLHSLFVSGVVRKVSSFQFGWRHVPVLLYPALVLFLGWDSPFAWAAAALAVVCNLRSLPAAAAWAWRRPGDTAIGACGLAALVCLVLLVSDLYAHANREWRVTDMPPGFYMGQFSASWGDEPMPYGVYVPPHFRNQPGPFPLVIFLHGYGERFQEVFLKNGLPSAIAHQFGEDKPNGPFEFVAFFPLDPSGMWRAGTPDMDKAMKVLDYVMERHQIDPATIYLTGISSGGSGVWSLAEAYPLKWAALAPLSALYRPNVEKVRHIPAWVFHGDKDTVAPIAYARTFVKELKEVNPQAKYTEVRGKEHSIWHETYRSKELFEWFAEHQR